MAEGTDAKPDFSSTTHIKLGKQLNSFFSFKMVIIVLHSQDYNEDYMSVFKMLRIVLGPQLVLNRHARLYSSVI